MPDIFIRQAQEADWTAVAKLLQVYGLPLNGAREHFDTYILAVFDGKVAGTAGLELYADAALLRSVAVTPSMRGRGIGHALIAGVDAEARQRGIKTPYLLTTTAKAYFARLGFSTRARELAPNALRESAEFQGACPSSSTFMSRAVTR